MRVDDALRRITAEGLVAAGGGGAAGAVLAIAGVYPRLGGFGEIPVYVASSYRLAAVALGGLVFILSFAVVLVVPGNGARG